MSLPGVLRLLHVLSGVHGRFVLYRITMNEKKHTSAFAKAEAWNAAASKNRCRRRGMGGRLTLNSPILSHHMCFDGGASLTGQA